jgi:hypothetical protein
LADLSGSLDRLEAGRAAGTLDGLRVCIASGVWKAQTGALDVAANATTIGATRYGGSVRQVNPEPGPTSGNGGFRAPC